MRKLSVALLTPYPPIRDGIASYALQLSKGLDSIGVNVFVLTWAECKGSFEDQERIRVLNIASPTKLEFISSVTRALSNLSPDVFHVQYGFRRDLYGQTLGEQLLPLLYVVHNRHIPIVMTVHDMWSKSDVLVRFGKDTQGKLKAIFYSNYLNILSKFVFRYTDAVIVHSSYFTDLLTNEYGVRSEKLFITRHGIRNYEPVDTQAAKSALGIRSKHVLLHLGVLYEGKRLDRLIHAMKYVVAELPDARLIIAGSPVERNGEKYVESLRDLSKRLGIEQYVDIRAGYVKDDQLPLYFSAATLVLVPYAYNTGASGLVNMSFGFEKPVISSFSPLRIDELGRDHAGGIAIPMNEPVSFAKAILNLLKNQGQYENLKRNTKVIKLQSSWANVAARTSEIYTIVQH